MGKKYSNHPAPNSGTPADWIPNIIIGQDYDQKYRDANIHYDALENLAVFFGRDMPVHRHAQYMQIHFIDKGNINFHIDDKLYQVEGPSLFLTPPAIPHSFQTSMDACGHVLTIHQSLVWKITDNGSRNEPEFNINEGVCLTAANLTKEQTRQWQFIQQLLDNIEEEWHSESLAKTMVLESFIYLLIIQIIRLSGHRAQSTVVNNDDLRLFHQFNLEIEKHFRDHWKLPQYTEVIGVSESRLHHICQRISNTSPKKIIRERLLKEVKRLLTFSKLTVNEISYELAFSDPAYFSRFFKSQTGLTALSYRKKTNIG